MCPVLTYVTKNGFVTIPDAKFTHSTWVLTRQGEVRRG